MEIKQPLCITSRLLPGVEIGGATISIEYAHVTFTGQQVYRWHIDKVDGIGHFGGTDLHSVAGGGTLQEGLESLLGFLSAFAEAVDYERQIEQASENANLFPAGLADWAVENADEITTLVYELEEHPGELIIE